MYYKSGLYINDIATLKRYSDTKFKLTLHRSLRQKGFELKNYSKKCSVNDEKLECNISRARSKIFEYAYCNNWEYFINLTINKEKYDRYNLKGYIKDLTQWLRNYCKKFKIKIQYLFIPEQHKDGAWHIHGLLMGLPANHLSEFVIGVHPQKLIDMEYKNWHPYSKKFGFVSVGEIKNHEACSKYITKYVTKDMANNNNSLNARLYYCSKGLNTAEIIKKGTMSANIDPDYENDYVKIKWMNDLENALSMFNK